MSTKENMDKDRENLEEENLEEEDLQEETEETLSEKDNDFEEVNARLLRLQADFMNYKKRTEKEKEGLVDYGIETIVSELLPILDNFERAMESETNKEDGFYKGIQMIQQQFIDVLNKNGVKEIDAVNKPFDPNYHHAVLMEESEDWEEGIIIDVFQKGYMLKDKVIRPSMVRVAK